VRVPAEPRTTLGEIAATAAESFEAPGTLAFVSFPDQEGRRHIAYGPSAIVDVDGGLRWVSYRHDTITIEELERSAREGLLEADPHAIALDARPIGNGGLVAWRELEQLVETMSGPAATALAIRGLAAVVVEDARKIGRIFQLSTRRLRIRRNAAWLRDFLSERKDTLLDAGAASPAPILNFILKRRDWDSSRLAHFLRIPHGDARRLLESLGYDLSPWSGTYLISRDPNRLHLRSELVHALLGGLDPLDFEPSDADLDHEEP